MTQQTQSNQWQNVNQDAREDSWHYQVFGLNRQAIAMDELRKFFDDGEADSMNFVLFSTSGVHGSYTTIEEVEKGPAEEYGEDVTFLIVMPRIVSLRYGTCIPKTPDDFAFLKKLRASSWKVVAEIGKPQA